ncbi:MAG: GNAT family N-acetyltransferase [Oscillospiraceae bacterium]|jgi:ribosomal protein S18 acetylase RimI-like enzyme|nr:GNAT family N-acetyltransferase [Oscillospiraceae bacterium]
MITTEFTQDEFAAACGHDILGTQLFTGWRLSRLYPAQIGTSSPENAVYTGGVFWVQRGERPQEDGNCNSSADDAGLSGKTVRREVTAALGFTQMSVTLTADEHADFDELRAFLHSIGCNHLECGARTAAGLDVDVVKTMYIQHRAADDTQAHTLSAGRVLAELSALNAHFTMRQAYDLWQAAGFGEYMSDYPDWLAIMSRKQKHALGEIYGLLEGETLLAAAAVFGRTERAAYLGGVAVREELRGQGLGAAVADYAARHTGSSEFGNAFAAAELLCEEHNRGFYRKCGFAEAGRVVFAAIR